MSGLVSITYLIIQVEGSVLNLYLYKGMIQVTDQFV